MPRDRYDLIKANIRFARSNDPGYRSHSAKGAGRYKRLWKAQRLLDAIRAVSQENFIPGTEVALDEMLVFSRCAFRVMCAHLRLWLSLVHCFLAQRVSASKYGSRGNQKEMDY
jgi:hypothetical protein